MQKNEVAWDQCMQENECGVRTCEQYMLENKVEWDQCRQENKCGETTCESYTC